MNWLKKLFNTKYKLNIDETILWNSIISKAKQGYEEYIKKYPNWHDNLCPPWIKDYTKEEYDLVYKIHEYFYPGWYSSWPISGAQVMYEMYENIKDKIKCYQIN